jgi:hypothetical protein
MVKVLLFVTRGHRKAVNTTAPFFQWLTEAWKRRMYVCPVLNSTVCSWVTL